MTPEGPPTVLTDLTDSSSFVEKPLTPPLYRAASASTGFAPVNRRRNDEDKTDHTRMQCGCLSLAPATVWTLAGHGANDHGGDHGIPAGHEKRPCGLGWIHSAAGALGRVHPVLWSRAVYPGLPGRGDLFTRRCESRCRGGQTVEETNTG